MITKINLGLGLAYVVMGAAALAYGEADTVVLCAIGLVFSLVTAALSRAVDL